MKIGILTFHSQLNYGAILQCLALQAVLQKAGHSVCIIDRWTSPNNSTLKEYLAPPLLQKKLFSAIVCGLFGSNDFGRGIRIVNTIRFINRYLRLTPYQFYDWQEVRHKGLDIDCIVVGSDQVWNGNYGFPKNYFLTGAPDDITAIGYAISFGMQKIPDKMKTDYIHGGKRFAHVSVREKSGVGLASEIGIKATWVADPTLLISRGEWCNLLDIKQKRRTKKTLVCYFMLENISGFLADLEEFSPKNICEICVYYSSRWANHLHPPKNFREFFKRLKPSWASKIKIMDSASPKQFVEAIANADYVISDSFHALMFSTIFQKDVFILSPHEETRIEMFARITDFVGEFASPEVVCDSLQTALSNIINNVHISYNYQKIERFCHFSLRWLINSITNT